MPATCADELRWRCVTPWGVLVLGCLQMSLDLSAFSIGVTAQDMKQVFNMTQEQFGVASAIYLVSSGSTLPAGPVLDRWGPTTVTVAALALAVLPHAAVSVLAATPVFRSQEILLYASLLLGGFGLATMTAAVMAVNLANFPVAQRGRVAGVLAGVGFLGTSLFSVLYTQVFSPNLSGYFIMITVLCAAFISLGVVFNVKLGSLQEYEPIEFLSVPEDTGAKLDLLDEAPVSQEFPSECCDRNGKCKYTVFVFSGLVFAMASVQTVWFYTYAISMGFSKYASVAVGLNPIVAGVGTIAIGYFSDLVLERCPRMNIFCGFNFAMTVVLFLSFFYMDSVVLLFLLVIINGCLLASCTSLILVEIHSVFGDGVFGTAMGIYFFIASACTIALQYLASVLYDRELRLSGATVDICHGSECFDAWTMIQTCLFAGCTAMNAFYVYSRRTRKGKAL